MPRWSRSRDRSFIQIEPAVGRPNHQFVDDPHGLGLELEWFRTRYLRSC